MFNNIFKKKLNLAALLSLADYKYVFFVPSYIEYLLSNK